jgi:DNA-binding beta-propeller fold protein YncE
MKTLGTLAPLFLIANLFAVAQSSPAPAPIATISLPGVTGKFDHFAIDLESNRLFAAATGNHTVEVINVLSGKVEQSIPGLGKPHGLVWIGKTHSLYVADGAMGELHCYQGTPLKLSGTLKLSDDADDMVYSEATKLLYVGHGGSDAGNPARVAVVDTITFKLKANLAVASHPEALDIDPAGHRIFANIAEASEVAVIDEPTGGVAAHWKLNNAADNVPMAYDAEKKLLYVASRKPASVIAINSETGAEVSRQPTAAGADDLFYDAEQQRVYVICGSGEVDIYEVDLHGVLHPSGAIHTESGAKTALFVPSQSKLYVGIPTANGRPAEIRVYSTATGKSAQ